MTQPLDPSFGALLRQRRQGAGLSQAALAERAGLSLDAIRALERGRRGAPRAETVGRLAAALGLTGQQLVAAMPSRRSPSEPREEDAPLGASPDGATPARHNLPSAPGDLIGRQGERARIRALLDGTRVLTLVGPGGIGKSRLALAVAADLLGDCADGVWLVELAALTDPALVARSVAQALRLRETPGRAVLAALAEQIADRRLLLVLDNCEHLLAACAELATTLLARCSGMRILATSREGLAVRGEQRYRVPGLSVPDAQRLPPLDLIGSYEAVRLFVARARAHWPGFTLSADNAQAVAEVCARLDGIPLAIELAAARSGLLPPAAIAARLDERFRLLTGGPRDAPSRQQTLRATMDWSWDLLGDQERMLLRRLAAFAGGWTLTAAEAVCAGADVEAWMVLDGLHELVNKSLVGPVEGEGTARYRLLETVRQYATERLRAAGEEAAVRDRHLSWCVALAEEAEPHLRGADQGRWLVRLEEEHDNLRAGLRWARRLAASEPALRLAAALWRFWYTRGHLSEGRDWLELALAMQGAAPQAIRAHALNGAGNLAQMLGDYGRAATRYEEALALRRALGDQWGIATALNNLGHVATAQGEPARAATLHEEALARFRALGDQHGIALSLSNLGNAANARGQYEQAAARHEEALVLRRALGDSHGIANTLNNLGGVAQAWGDHARAAALHEEALALRRALGDQWGIATSLNNLGSVAHARGDHARAAALHEEARAHFRTLGDRHGTALSLSNLASVANTQGDSGRATALHEEALALYGELGDKLSAAETLEALARLAAARGAPVRAARLLAAATSLRQALQAMPPPRQQAENDRLRAALHHALGDQAFAVAWTTGAALTIEAAIAQARVHDGRT